MSAGRRRQLLVLGAATALRSLLVEQLGRAEDIEIRAEESAAPGFLDGSIDLILLSGGAADADLAAVRRRQPEIPILALDGAVPVDAAVDEVLRLPVRLALLLDRVQVHLAVPRGPAVIAQGYRLDPAERRLSHDGWSVRLTETEMRLLQFLRQADGRPVTRDLLLTAVWGYNSGTSTHTLETHVYRLRRKLRSGPGPKDLINSEPGGYRLVP